MIFSNLAVMKTAPTYDELRQEVIRLKERVAYLERLLYGAKSDKLLSKVPEDQPSLFDDLFKEALDKKASEIEQAKKEIEKEAQERQAKAKKSPKRPGKYHYHGLEERTTVIMPDDVDASQCDVIGKDVTRVLHHEAARVWVEVIERPILRLKSEKNALRPKFFPVTSLSSCDRWQPCGGRHALPHHNRQIPLSSARIPPGEAICRLGIEVARVNHKRLGACRGGETIPSL